MERPFVTRSCRQGLLSWALSGPEGASARVVVAWTLAGGAVSGGLVTAGLELAGRSTPGLLILLGPVLYLVGSFLGAVSGAVLGVAGRPEGTSRRDAMRRVGFGLVASIVLQPLSWLTSASITVGSALFAGFRVQWFVVGLVGWVIGIAVCLWALYEARPLIRRIFARVGDLSSELAEGDESPPTVFARGFEVGGPLP